MKIFFTFFVSFVVAAVIATAVTQMSYAPYRTWKWSIPVDGENVAESEVVSSESGN